MISAKEITPQSAIDVTLFSFLGLSVKREPLLFLGYMPLQEKGVRGWVGSLKGDFC
jgi:hypothetical protein